MSPLRSTKPIDGDGPGRGLMEAFALIAGCITLVGGIVAEGDRRLPLFVISACALISLALSLGFSPPRRRDRAGDYWWVGLAIPMGFGTWTSFAYIGARFHSVRFLFLAGAYLAAIVGAVLLNLASHDEGIGSDIAAAIMGGVWLLGGLHGFLIRKCVAHRFARNGHGDVHPVAGG